MTDSATQLFEPRVVIDASADQSSKSCGRVRVAKRFHLIQRGRKRAQSGGSQSHGFGQFSGETRTITQ